MSTITKKRNLTIRVTDEERAKIYALAAKKGVSSAQLIRELVLEKITEKKKA